MTDGACVREKRDCAGALRVFVRVWMIEVIHHWEWAAHTVSDLIHLTNSVSPATFSSILG